MKKPVLNKIWVARCIVMLWAYVGSTPFIHAQNAPIAGDDENYTYQDYPVTGNVYDNDYDLDGDNLTYSIVTGTENGVWDLAADGNYTYTPNQFVYGVETLIYQVCDEDGMCSQGTLTMYVIFLNDAPQANNDFFYAQMNTTRNFDVSQNDFEPDNEIMLFYMLLPPSHGTASINVYTGIVSYTPHLNYVGPDNFIYQACDPCNVCDQGVVSIEVLANNEPPSISAINLTMNEDQVLIGSLTEYTEDPENDQLFFQSDSPSEFGLFNVSDIGDFTFTPYENFHGLISLTFGVCDIVNNCTTGFVNIQIQNINDAPIANVDNFETNEDEVLSGDVSFNDEDIDSDILYFSISQDCLHGTISMNSNGSFTYIPHEHFFGLDNFVYQVCDDSTACAYAEVSITIQPINDAPVLGINYFSTNENQPLESEISNVFDIDSENLYFTTNTNSPNGQMNLSNNGSFVYIPNPNWFGIDTLELTVCDDSNDCAYSQIIINVTHVIDPPSIIDEFYLLDEDGILNGDVSLNDDSFGEGSLFYEITIPPTNGNIQMSQQGSFSYTPIANWSGLETIQYVACNSNEFCGSGSLTILVNPINDLPVCSNITIQLEEDTQISIQLPLATDVDGDSLLSSIINYPDHGTANISNNNSLLYAPGLNFNGQDEITLTFCDQLEACCSSIITISVTAINDTPVAQSGEMYGLEDSSMEGHVPFAIDDDDDILSYYLVSNPNHGIIIFNSDGYFNYEPNDNFNGNDSIHFSVCDPYSACDTAVFVFHLDPVNDLPVVGNESLIIIQNESISGDLADNDYDIESTILSYTLLEINGPGQIEITSQGIFTYASSELGISEVIYQVCDQDGGCTLGLLTLTIISSNTPPITADTTFMMQENAILATSLLNLVSDSEGGELNFTLINNDIHANITITNNGNITVVPTPNYHGLVLMSYAVCDFQNLCDTGYVIIQVEHVNYPPDASSLNITMLPNQTIVTSLNQSITDDSDESFTFALVSSNFEGDINLNPEGGLTLTSEINIFGNFNIIYQVCDGEGLCTEVISFIQIQELQISASAENGFISVNENGTYTNSLEIFINNPQQEILLYSIISGPQHGEITIDEDGNYSYIPESEYFGNDEFQFTICNPTNACDTALIQIEVVFINNIPIAIDDYFMVLEDSYIIGSVALNDIELDDEAVTYSIISNPIHGIIILNTDGTFTYTPEANYYGMDQIIYMMCDPCGACDIGIAEFEVTFINDIPIVIDESIFVYQNTFFEGDVSTNDIELDNEDLTYFVIEDNSGGLFELFDDGTFYYVPGDDALGIFTLEYMACDPCGACDIGTLTIEVAPLEGGNTPPILNQVNANVCLGSTLTLDLSPYVFDLEDEDDMLDLYNYLPDYGYAEINGTLLTYIPDPIYIGTVSILYEGCDTGSPSLCSSNNIIINISPLDNPSISDLYVENVLCYGENTGMIDIIEVTSIGNPTITWSDGVVASSIENITAGEYVCTITTDAACSMSTTFSITVSGPLSPIQIEADVMGISENGNGTIDLGLSGGLEPYSLSWAGASGSQDGNSLVDIVSVGTYFVTIEDANGCSIDTSFVISSIEEWMANNFMTLWPNPTSENSQLLISGLPGYEAQLQITDISGKIITTSNLGVLQNFHQVLVNVSDLASGTYYIQIKTKRGMLTMPLIRI
jgi:large repetitive protein